MRKIRSLTRWHTDPDLYRSSIQQRDKNTIQSSILKNTLPAKCNQKLIRDYFDMIQELDQCIFYDTTSKIMLQRLSEPYQENPYAPLKHYIQSAERLSCTNQGEILMKSGLLASIIMSSLITLVLLIVIPSLAVFALTIASFLLIALPICSVLFCGIGVSGYREIIAAKQAFQDSEERLKNTLQCIQIAADQTPAPHVVSAPTDISSTSGYNRQGNLTFFPKHQPVASESFTAEVHKETYQCRLILL